MGCRGRATRGHGRATDNRRQLQEDGRVSWVLAISGRELEGHVDTSFPGSEFREWLLGKLTPNPDKPSCSPG